MLLKTRFRLILVISLTLIFIFPGPVLSNEGCLYRPLRISKSRLLSGFIHNMNLTAPSSGFRSSFVCSRLCSETEWCNLWCKDSNSEKNCLLYKLYVAPQYQENQLQDAVTCHIKHTIDHAVGTAIEGVPPIAIYPTRTKENMVDGIYTKQVGECYFPSVTYNPFFKLDLRSVKPVQRVAFVLQANAYARVMYNIEIRVGKHDLQEPYFPVYQSFGHFPGPSWAGKEVVFERPSPVMARYVLLRRLSDPSVCTPGDPANPGDCSMQICHIEVN